MGLIPYKLGWLISMPFETLIFPYFVIARNELYDEATPVYGLFHFMRNVKSTSKGLFAAQELWLLRR
jgi:hypothetical protein